MLLTSFFAGAEWEVGLLFGLLNEKLVLQVIREWVWCDRVEDCFIERKLKFYRKRIYR